MKKYKTNIKSWENGQILLILVMIMAIAITIVLTITFTTRTDTQMTKLEEDSQKALAAAEAGIESSLKNNSSISDITSLSSLGSNISSGSTTIASSSASTFTSPKIVSGEAYTTYLSPYTAGSPPSWGIGSNNSAVTICFGDANTAPSLDIAILKTSSVVRYLADPGSNFGGSNKLSTSTSVSGICPVGFAYTTTVPAVGVDSRLMVIRTLFGSTKLYVSQTSLPAQGKTVTSQATTTTGVTKKVQLFQSFPQIPAEFFFTMF